MSINYAILGMLSHKPLAGYDLKKAMQKSSFMYWSGNNNQIYKALVELKNDGFVEWETHQQEQEKLPSKKIYTITHEGREELKKWALACPEAPEIRKPFLIQLAGAVQASKQELCELLEQYGQMIKALIVSEERKKREEAGLSIYRSPREVVVLGLIHDNILNTYYNELSWINKACQVIRGFDGEQNEQNDPKKPQIIKEDKKMEFTVIQKGSEKYIAVKQPGKMVQTEQDALDLITICAENDTYLLLIFGERLTDGFFKLSTGVANNVLSKLNNYNIKTAVVIDEDRVKGKFRDFAAESNRGSVFRVYYDLSEAERWLLGKK